MVNPEAECPKITITFTHALHILQMSSIQDLFSSDSGFPHSIKLVFQSAQLQCLNVALGLDRGLFLLF